MTYVDVDKLTGMTVVSMSEGAKLGKIDGALFDPQSLRLTALKLKGDSGEFIVPLEQVRAIGTDAVTVASSQVTQVATTSGAETLVNLRDLQKRKVVNAAGTLLGALQSLDIDPITGEVSSLMVHKGGLLGLGGETTAIAAASIQTIGNDLITVTE